MTPLIAAAMNGHSDVVEELLAANATVGLADGDGDTALLLSSQEGHGSIVRALLDAGACPEARNSAGFTPQECAEDEGWIEVAGMLEAHAEAQRK